MHNYENFTEIAWKKKFHKRLWKTRLQVHAKLL